MLGAVLLLVAGLGLLYFCADWLVDGASDLAFRLGVAPLIIGLTVVAAGTSAPELVVTLDAAGSGASALSLGNILGSNICNIALILGVAALIRPIHVDQDSMRRDYPIMLLSSGLLYAFCALTPGLARWEGGVLFAGMLGYMALTIARARRGRAEHLAASERRQSEREDGEGQAVGPQRRLLHNLGLIAAGLIGLVVGARLVVDNAVDIARAFGVAEFIIAVTVVAFGTSLPELATSAVASLRGESDISIGNVVGSNIFNVMMVLGVVPLLFGLAIEQRTLSFDFPIMLGISVALYPIMRTGFLISRAKGAMLLGSYVAYVIALFVAR